MTLCPIALAIGCKRCAIFSICPVKSVIGDYRPDAADGTAPKDSTAAASKTQRKRKTRR